MHIFYLEINLRIDSAYSLKEKRQILLSLRQKTEQTFPVISSEAAYQELHNLTTLAFVSLNISLLKAKDSLTKVLNYIESNFPVEILDYYIEER